MLLCTKIYELSSSPVERKERDNFLFILIMFRKKWRWPRRGQRSEGIAAMWQDKP